MKHLMVDITGKEQYFVAGTGEAYQDTKKYDTFKEADGALKIWKRAKDSCPL